MPRMEDDAHTKGVAMRQYWHRWDGIVIVIERGGGDRLDLIAGGFKTEEEAHEYLRRCGTGVLPYRLARINFIGEPFMQSRIISLRALAQLGDATCSVRVVPDLDAR